MYAQAEKSKENKNRAKSNSVTQKAKSTEKPIEFTNNQLLYRNQNTMHNQPTQLMMGPRTQLAARSQSSSIGQNVLITFQDTIDAADVRRILSGVRGNVVIITGVHNGEIGAATREIEFTREDSRSLLAAGQSNFTLINAGQNIQDAQDQIAQTVSNQQPCTVIWASCKSNQDVIVPAILQAIAG